MRNCVSIILPAALLLISAPLVYGQSNADSRTALIIGNSNYAHFGNLANPGNDASDVSQALEALGFEVTLVMDAQERELFEAVRAFGDALAREKGLGLFYYAGHGIEVGGINYLVPVDADIQAEDEVEFASIALDFVLSKMETAGNSSNILILDACRDNPLPASTRSTATRGLTVVQAPAGSLIVYATDPGQAALDGDGRNSPFTEAFLNHVNTPGLDVELMFRNVRTDVVNGTGGRQTPWTNSSLTQNISLAAGAVTGTTGPGSIAVRRSTGTLVISTEEAGALYVDGEFLVNLLADETITLDNVPVGARSLEFRSTTGSQSRAARIAEGAETEIRFSTALNQTFTLLVDPGFAGVEVLVDGTRLGSTPLAAEVPAGTRAVQLRGDFILPVTAHVDGNPRSLVEFSPDIVRLGRLTIEAEVPDGYRVVLDGEVVSFDGLSDLVPIDTHNLSIRHPLLQDNRTEVDVAYAREVRVSPVLLPRVGELEVIGVPDFVRVYVDGELWTPRQDAGHRLDQAAIGERVLRFESPFDVSYETRSVVQEGGRTSLLARAGVLMLRDLREGTELTLNGRPVPSGSHDAREISLSVIPGEYEVAAHGEWIVPMAQRVRVEDGGVVELSLRGELGGRLVLELPPDEALRIEIEGRSLAEATSFESVSDPAVVVLPPEEYVVRARRASDIDWAFEEPVSLEARRERFIDLSRLAMSPTFQIQELRGVRTELEKVILPEIELHDFLTVGGWVSFGAGALGTGIALLGYLLADVAYTEYANATTSAAAVAAANRVDTWTTVFAVGVGIGGAGVSLGPALWLFRPPIEAERRELQDIDARIRELEALR